MPIIKRLENLRRLDILYYLYLCGYAILSYFFVLQESMHVDLL